MISITVNSHHPYFLRILNFVNENFFGTFYVNKNHGTRVTVINDFHNIFFTAFYRAFY